MAVDTSRDTGTGEITSVFWGSFCKGGLKQPTMPWKGNIKNKIHYSNKSTPKKILLLFSKFISMIP